MGVVYKAEDRAFIVLLRFKFLPDKVASDPHALARFDAKLRLPSALEPSKYLHDFDIGGAGRASLHRHGVSSMPTLKHRIAGRPLDIKTLLSLAVEIADALDAAHTPWHHPSRYQPGKYFVTKRGRAKILDFGLAKLTEGDERCSVGILSGK